ncbi:histone H1-like [Neoarius graeffei]|uniref:histone H1-like n=1 Tax=Neoarius graeffei TaxID=443677 RepID=UPI00298D42FF|nr:histone H1-like [Neoarius graeffei]
MTEVAPATAMPGKVPKKKAASRTKKSGPSIGELLIKAVSSSKERNSMSLSALKKTLQATRYDVEKNNHHVKIAIRNLLAKGILVQTRGTSASGSFKLNRKLTKGQKPTKEATKKPTVAKKPKKVVAKKPTVTTKKSPKMAKKPPAATKKATKSPKAKNLPTPPKAAKISKKTKIDKPNTTKPKTAKAKKAAPKKK